MQHSVSNQKLKLSIIRDVRSFSLFFVACYLWFILIIPVLSTTCLTFFIYWSLDKKEAEKYDVYMLKQPLGELYLDNILEGIILNLSSLDFFRDIEYYKEILNHNKFLGFLSSKDEFL